MKQKWPILIFSALLTAFIVLAGIWGNAQFEHLHSGSVLTAQHAAQGIALDGWRQEAPGQWHFTFTVGEDIPSLTLCVTNTAVPLAPESLTSLERSGELYALDVTPGETVELVFTCGRSPLKNEPLLMLILNFLPLALGYLLKCYKFHKQGFGEAWDKGMREAFDLLKNGQLGKRPFRLRDLPNYVLMELWMIWNMVPYLWYRLVVVRFDLK